MRPLVVLQTGDPPAEIEARRGPFSRWIERGVGDAWTGGWRTYDVRAEGVLPELDGMHALVITGSASSVTERAPWILRTEAYLRDAVRAGVPVLGICFGHQLVAEALGGHVTANPRGREIGTVTARRVPAAGAPDPLFDGLDDAFDVNATHVDAVTTLPAGARVLATTDLDPVAAFAIGDRVRCVQFHPEMDGDAMRGYVRARADRMRDEGLDVARVERAARDTPAGGAILRNFVRHFVAR